MNTEALGLWDEAKKEIQLVLDHVQFSTWVERLDCVDLEDGNKLVLSAPSEFPRKNLFLLLV